MPQILLTDLLSTLSEYPDLFNSIKFDDVGRFIDIACIVKPILSLGQSVHKPGSLKTLPVRVHQFLQACLGLDDDTLKLLWEALRDKIWAVEFNNQLLERLASQYLPYFLEHGPAQQIAFYTFIPPSRTCLDSRCNQPVRAGTHSLLRERELGEDLRMPVVVFTQEHGAIPGYSHSLYCRSMCFIVIHDRSVRAERVSTLRQIAGLGTIQLTLFTL